MSKQLTNPEAEKALLSCLIQYGEDVYHDINSMVTSKCFTRPENILIYSAISKLLDVKKVAKLDDALILKECSELENNSPAKYLLSDVLADLHAESVSKENGSHFAKSVVRCSILRELLANLDNAKQSVIKADQERPVLEIVSDAEKVFFDFNTKIVSHSNDTINLGESAKDLIDYYAATKPTHMGIPTGFKAFDTALGGGIRGPGVAVIGARPKAGKTSLSTNILLNVASLGIPVLYLDTEMTKDQIQTKMVANLSKIQINNIEHGAFADNASESEQIQQAVEKFAKLPIHYHNISGFSHHQTISVIRRWLNVTVGFDSNGNLNKCLVILDYLKTMDTGEFKNKNLSEFQYLGQYITDLHNFCVPFKLPILAFVQLIRDGIDREDAAAISGSDRIVWICTSFSMLKAKSSEDFIEDGAINGDRKLLVKNVRFGPGLDDTDYINIKTNFGCAIMVEGQTHKQVRSNKNNNGPDLRTKDDNGGDLDYSI